MSLLLLLLLLVLLLQLLLLLLRHNSGDYNKYMVSEVQYVDIVSHISMKSGGDNTDLEGVEVISHLSMKEGGSDAHMHDVEVVSHISMQSKLSEHHRRILGKRSVAEAIADVEQHIAQHASRTIIDNSQLEHDDGKPCEEQLDKGCDAATTRRPEGCRLVQHAIQRHYHEEHASSQHQERIRHARATTIEC